MLDNANDNGKPGIRGPGVHRFFPGSVRSLKLQRSVFDISPFFGRTDDFPAFYKQLVIVKAQYFNRDVIVFV